MEYLQKGVKPEDAGYTVEDYLNKAEQLKIERQQCLKAAFDMTVRKVIDSGLVYKHCRHTEVIQNNGKGEFQEFRPLATFMYKCLQCGQGVNRHECHIEGEVYYMTCNEARVVNMASRNYGLEGSISTATKFRD